MAKKIYHIENALAGYRAWQRVHELTKDVNPTAFLSVTFAHGGLDNRKQELGTAHLPFAGAAAIAQGELQILAAELAELGVDVNE